MELRDVDSPYFFELLVRRLTSSPCWLTVRSVLIDLIGVNSISESHEVIFISFSVSSLRYFVNFAFEIGLLNKKSRFAVFSLKALLALKEFDSPF